MSREQAEENVKNAAKYLADVMSYKTVEVPEEITQAHCDSTNVSDINGVARTIGSAIDTFLHKSKIGAENSKSIKSLAIKWFKSCISFISFAKISLQFIKVSFNFFVADLA